MAFTGDDIWCLVLILWIVTDTEIFLENRNKEHISWLSNSSPGNIQVLYFPFLSFLKRPLPTSLIRLLSQAVFQNDYFDAWSFIYILVLLVSSRRPNNEGHFSSIILSLFTFLVVKVNVLSLVLISRQSIWFTNTRT